MIKPRRIRRAVVPQQRGGPPYVADFDFDEAAGFDARGVKTGNDRTNVRQLEFLLETTIDTLLFNAFLDIPLADGLSLYAGGGAGGAIVSFEAGDFDSDDTVFAYKFAAGLSYAFTPELGADLGYEYLATEDVELDRIDLKDVNTNNIVLALKYMF